METQPFPRLETPGKFSTYLALGCFSIGTSLFLFYLIYPMGLLLIIGYLFVIAAFYTNLAVLFYLCYLLIVYWHDRQTIVIRMLILVSNIPIALLYLNIVFHNKLF